MASLDSKQIVTVGIQSLGDMGAGIARLLLAHGFHVVTNTTGRSEDTLKRAQHDGIQSVSSDVELCNAADYVLSILPPRDALAMAQRIVDATSHEHFKPRSHALYYLELNAISPTATRQINNLFATQAPHVKVLDGGIIGGPPQLKEGQWSVPKIALSGPHHLQDSPSRGTDLAQTLNTQHINDTIGSASGLKMCFASLSKGFTALAIQSFTTAHNMGVLPELKEYLEAMNPNTLKSAERSLPSMCPKAYRWVKEMEDIGQCFHDDGGFSPDENIFGAVAKVYALVADGTELGAEKVGRRQQGQTADDVARLMSEGTAKRGNATE